MRPYERYGISGSAYDPHSPYSEQPTLRPTVYGLPGLGESEHREAMQHDAGTLAEFLTPAYFSESESTAELVFGPQTHRLKLSLEHVANLIAERSRLHKRQHDDINARHLQIQERLFGARLHARLDGYRRATKLEQVLLQLDEQRRREEVQFWKDTVELRDKLFEQAGDYHALHQRRSLLESFELGGEAYD